MITLDLNKPLLNLDNEAVKDETDKVATIGVLLASQLINSAEGDALKFLDWAITLKQGKPLQLDGSDKQTLESFVKGVKTLTNLGKGRILQEIAAAKEVK